MITKNNISTSTFETLIVNIGEITWKINSIYTIAFARTQRSSFIKSLQAVATKNYRYIPVQGNAIGSNCLFVDSEKLGPVTIHPSLKAYPLIKSVRYFFTSTKSRPIGLFALCNVSVTFGISRPTNRPIVCQGYTMHNAHIAHARIGSLPDADYSAISACYD